MTFILGMHFDKGVILCADTLESGGSTKKYRDKIEAFHADNWQMVWAGSGNAAVVDRFTSILYTALKPLEDKPFHRQTIEEKIDLALEAVGQQFSRERIEVVFALAGKVKKDKGKKAEIATFIYKADSYSCCAAPISDYCIAGMDVTLASFFLSSAYTRAHLIGLQEAQRLSFCAANLMKKYAEGVDGDIAISYLETEGEFPGSFLVPEKLTMHRLEQSFPVSDMEAKLKEYWADMNPNSWAKKDLDYIVARMRRRARRSASRKSKGRQ